MTCFVCHQPILGTNTSSHLSSAHGFTRQLPRYLLDTERIRRQQGPDILYVKDCLPCLRRFVACTSRCHQLPECVLVDLPNYMDPESLCEEAKIINALCVVTYFHRLSRFTFGLSYVLFEVSLHTFFGCPVLLLGFHTFFFAVSLHFFIGCPNLLLGFHTFFFAVSLQTFFSCLILLLGFHTFFAMSYHTYIFPLRFT